MSAADRPGRTDARFRRPPHAPDQKIGPERLLVGFLIVGWGLLVRAMGRVFGVSPEGSTLLTLVVIGSVARGVRRALAAPHKQVRKVRSSPNFAGDTMIATAVIKESVDGIAGAASREMPFAAALIVFALVAHFFRPAVSASIGALRKSVAVVMAQGLRLRAWFANRAALISARNRDVVAGAAGHNSDARSDQVGNGQG
jgi:hypothetical protein